MLYSVLMFAAFMIGHHFSSSALWKAPSASGVCWSRGGTSRPNSVEVLSNGGIGECLHHGGVEPGWTISLDVPFGHPDGIPDRHVEARQTGLVHGQDVRQAEARRVRAVTA